MNHIPYSLFIDQKRIRNEEIRINTVSISKTVKEK